MASFTFIFALFYALLEAIVVQALPPGSTYPGVAHQPVKKVLTLNWKIGNPNGNARPMIFVNDQFPAPTLEFNEGDDVEVRISIFMLSIINDYQITVHNQMPINTTIHWHGLL